MDELEVLTRKPDQHVGRGKYVCVDSQVLRRTAWHLVGGDFFPNAAGFVGHKLLDGHAKGLSQFGQESRAASRNVQQLLNVLVPDIPSTRRTNTGRQGLEG